MRRFHSVIHFPAPGVNERLHLWKSIFDLKFKLDKQIDFEKLAEEYEITGGLLVNVLRYCAGKAIQHKNTITLEDIKEGINREIRKEGKIV